MIYSQICNKRIVIGIHSGCGTTRLLMHDSVAQQWKQDVSAYRFIYGSNYKRSL